jgi:outer membrane immunogenic protein
MVNCPTFAGRGGAQFDEGRSMRSVFLYAAAAFAVAGPASAADLAVKARPVAPAFIASPWDGFYVGGNVGVGDTDFSVDGIPNAKVSGSGVLGGFQTGYNKQIGAFVLGAESDIDLTAIDKTTSGVTTKLPWFGTTRTRAGYLVTPSLLAYGTGGVAYGRAEVSAAGTTVKVPGVGWAAGAGLQYQLGGGWSVGAEYLHIELDGPSVNTPAGSISTKAETDLGRGTLNYKF